MVSQAISQTPCLPNVYGLSKAIQYINPMTFRRLSRIKGVRGDLLENCDQLILVCTVDVKSKAMQITHLKLRQSLR